jgi:hypothetical protein
MNSIINMKQYILLCFVCVLGMTIAANGTNTTSSINNDLLDDESFYTIDVVLVADGISIPTLG